MKAIVFIHDEEPDKNGDQVDIDGLIIPPSVPLRLNFEGEQIGSACLQREGRQIVAELYGLPTFYGVLYPAISFRVLEGSCEDNTLKVTKAEIIEVSLGPCNADTRIPPLISSLRRKA